MLQLQLPVLATLVSKNKKSNQAKILVGFFMFLPTLLCAHREAYGKVPIGITASIIVLFC
jgi:hypothetical protein